MKLIIFYCIFVASSGFHLFLRPINLSGGLKNQQLRKRSRGHSSSLFTSLTNNKEVSPDEGMKGRFFSAFNNLNLGSLGISTNKIQRREFNNLVARVTAMEASAGALPGKRGNLDETLRKALAEVMPRCPSAAIDSRMVGDRCYSVEVESVEFDEAAQICQSKGGILAEPAVATRKQFYDTIKAAFPAELKLIEARKGTLRNLFIGLRQSKTFSTTFEFLSCGVTINAFDDKIFTSIPKIDFQVAQKAVVVPPGTMWQRVGSLKGDEKHSFICQFDPLL